MKKIQYPGYAVILLLLVQSPLFARPGDVSEKVKTYFNEVLRQVETAENPADKRVLLNDSFDRITRIYEWVAVNNSLSGKDTAAIAVLRRDIEDKKNELNGWNGFEQVDDSELDEFADYAQQSMEQALDRTITISLGTAIIIGLLLILI